MQAERVNTFRLLERTQITSQVVFGIGPGDLGKFCATVRDQHTEKALEQSFVPLEKLFSREAALR